MTFDSNTSQGQGKKIVLVHCWRGGMRSAGVAWLLDLYGFKVYTLVGGHKFFRRWALQQFELAWELNILGGYTGSGKTEILKQLADHGESVIDLESIASHKGSAFGNIGLPAQPSQEMFENKLALQFFLVVNNQGSGKNGNEEKLPASQPQTVSIWMEDESQRIGSVNIPQALWLRMRNSRIFFLDIPFAERLGHIAEEYGNLDKERMIAAIERIQKRLERKKTKMAIQFLEEEKIMDGFRILLKYYDKWYLKGLKSRNNVNELCDTITLRQVNAVENAIQLLQNSNRTTTQKKLIDEPGYR
jgi:tRNA 2-selenouridine synthase